MKKAFSIYVPDNCHIQALQIAISVQKDDLSTNGLTMFTRNPDDFKDRSKAEEWLFGITDNARQIKLYDMQNAINGNEVEE